MCATAAVLALSLVHKIVTGTSTSMLYLDLGLTHVSPLKVSHIVATLSKNESCTRELIDNHISSMVRPKRDLPCAFPFSSIFKVCTTF